MKKAVIGILAHVDAGKTTLSESMLYLSGMIRKQGRVDHKDAFLDYNSLERNRGITIFSKQAKFNWNDVSFTFLDTPGHVDFSSEMERTLQVLDYAILLISGIDGVQTHTRTIFELLKHYQVPTFIFVNKMDNPICDKEDLLNKLQSEFGDSVVDFSSLEEQYETIALGSEELLDEYLSEGTLSLTSLQVAISHRLIFPCFFGSALKNQGVKEFMDNLSLYINEKAYSESFGATVFKVTYEDKTKLTHVKITGGRINVKDEIGEEKVDQIRLYEGNKYTLINTATAGDVCTLKGLKNVNPGDTLGESVSKHSPVLTPYMNYRMILPSDVDYNTMMSNIRQLADEDPNLHIKIGNDKDVMVSLMGEIQIEILKSMMKERFNVDVSFDQGQIIYKETIRDAVEGVGHFEPLRHYAEVHLLLEPLDRDEGLVFTTHVKEDVLEKRYQRLVLTHLLEKEHIGVLTGSPITDMKVTLVAGRAHLKHTEGGDFREATYRAIRQGLKMAESVLLEPYYSYRLEIDKNYLSRAIFDIENRNGTYEIIDDGSNNIVLTGEAPVRKMQNYLSEVINYTSGAGRLYLSMGGYKECIDSEEIVSSIGYNSEADTLNPTGSVFCSHGAGYYVSYDEVYEHMHLPLYTKQQVEYKPTSSYSSSLPFDDELESIFERTYGPVKRRLYDDYTYKNQTVTTEFKKAKPECLLVDGYNVIHSWDELREIAEVNLDNARERLIDILGNYQGYKQNTIIVVFDAYKVKGNMGSYQQIHNMHVVYTKEAQTADMYIERATHDLSQNYNVIVATSDALEQMIVIGRGARRMSSRELKLDVEAYTKEKMSEFERKQDHSKVFLLEDVKNYKN